MNSYGRLFRINIYGESHGEGVGILIDGCPAGISITKTDFERDLMRRKSGETGTTSRIEADCPLISTGIFKEKSTGAPILIGFRNINVKSKDYNTLMDIPRPGHADFTAKKKYGGFNDFRGGGHFSGRLTLGLVAAGVIAKKVIKPVEIHSILSEAGGEKNTQQAVKRSMANNDSIGGLIETEVKNVPVGIGEPFFDSVESLLSHLIFSIPGIKGIEFGSGFKGTTMTGSKHNDLIVDKNGKTDTNHAGGINGGITNGNPIRFRVAVKPTSSIPRNQLTMNFRTGKKEDLKITGRHDTCFALRVPVIVEAVTAIGIADLLLLEQRTSRIVDS